MFYLIMFGWLSNDKTFASFRASCLSCAVMSNMLICFITTRLFLFEFRYRVATPNAPTCNNLNTLLLHQRTTSNSFEKTQKLNILISFLRYNNNTYPFLRFWFVDIRPARSSSTACRWNWNTIHRNILLPLDLPICPRRTCKCFRKSKNNKVW